MGENINTRIKRYLIDIMKEEENVEAWQYFIKLNPTFDELKDIIQFTPFKKKAWEIIKKLEPNKDILLHLAEYGETIIQKEAEDLLLNNFDVDAVNLENIVLSTESDKAAIALLKKNPTNDQLLTIVKHSNMSDEAAKEMLKIKQDNYELFAIIKHSNLKKIAWEKLITQSPTSEEIIEIVQETDFDEVAWDFLKKQNPPNHELSNLVNDYGESGKKKEEAVDYILKNNPSISDLINTIKNEIRIHKAWDLMLKKKPNDEELQSIIWRLIRLESSMKNEVATWCLKFNPNKEDLFYILEYTDIKDEAALQLIEKPLELHELADIIIHSTIEPVLNFVSKRVKFDRSQINEDNIIQEITSKILANPNLLDVNHWHTKNTNCLGGWAIALNEKAQQIEKQYGSEIAACLLIPNYKHLLFEDKEKVIKELANFSFS